MQQIARQYPVETHANKAMADTGGRIDSSSTAISPLQRS
jgi:hypothetical protein